MSKTDSEIQREVLRELKWDTRVEETEVGVSVDDGVVTLTGTVSSWAKRTAAQQAAHRVNSVRDVANDLKVHLPQSAIRTDTEIASLVRDALETDASVPEERIRSTVSDGWVLLEGEVDYWSQWEDADSCVSKLKCVRGVTNRIHVAPQPLAAAEVKQSIEAALKRQAQREARRIEVQVHDGEVSVSGAVHSWHEKNSVLGAVRGTPGVRRVEDRILVRPFT